MTEFDFDELDKAVNSLMSPNKKDTEEASQADKPDETAASQSDSQPPKSNPDAVVAAATRQVNAATKAADAPAPAVVPEIAPQDVASPAAQDDQTVAEAEKPDNATEQSQQAAPPAPASLATKRRGQFMDMKHPSASMKRNTATNEPVSRSGITIAPPTAPSPSPDTEPAASSDTAPASDEPVVAPNDNQEQDSAEETAKPETSTPVPAETPEAHEEASESGEVQPEVVPTAEQNLSQDTPDEVSDKDDLPDTSADEADAPNSPFLPGAKVEKRPLGGAAPTGPADLPELSDDDGDGIQLEQPADDIEPAKTHTASALPRELHESVMKVESDTTTAEKNVPEQPSADSGEQKTAPQSSSIPQQYESKPGSMGDDTTEPTSSSLYDSPGVPDNMPTMPKKKSHLAVVAAIVGLILVGGAVGAVVYLLQTGSL